MKIINSAIAAATFLMSAGAIQTAHAEPVQFDTDDAHVIVIRPIDVWSPNEYWNDYVITNFKRNQIRYGVVTESGVKRSGDDDALAKQVSELAKPFGFEVGGFRSIVLAVAKPVSMSAQDMTGFNKAQDEIYGAIVKKAGNPARLTSSTRHQQWLGTALSALTLGIGVKELGSLGIQAAQGPMQDVFSLTMQARKVLVPQPSVPFDYSAYQSIDIRRVTADQVHIGQIIIAYRGEKTAESEDRALAKAIVSVSGADSSLDAIKTAQAKDLADRQALWDACVAAKECVADD